jgi:transcriptional regulator with XRE-family HTH domain
MDILNIGENIRNIRKNQKLTLKELGIKISLSEQAIGQYERGEREPNIETLNKIANALEVSLNDLLKDTDIVNLTEADKELREMYSNFLASDINFPIILATIESYGYKLLQNTNNWDVSIIKNKSVVATIPEKEFIDHGKQMLANIKRYTEFEVYKVIDDYYFLYNEE